MKKLSKLALRHGSITLAQFAQMSDQFNHAKLTRQFTTREHGEVMVKVTKMSS